MKFYLSSYKLGNETEKLKEMVPGKKIGYIPNALDFSETDLERRRRHIEADVDSLRNLGFEIEIVDLRDYFNRQSALRNKLEELKAIFISGGNVFILRQVMRLSGLDKILEEFLNRQDFFYAGYSAAGCVLSPNLKVYEIVDNAEDMPYKGLKETIWEGLGFIEFAFMPHWKSNHPESVDIEKEVKYCKENNIPYKTVRDGEVLIM